MIGQERDAHRLRFDVSEISPPRMIIVSPLCTATLLSILRCEIVGVSELPAPGFARLLTS